MDASQIGKRTWSYAGVLQDAGLSCCAWMATCPPADLERSQPQGLWRGFAYKDLLQRDKLNRDIFWIMDDSLTDTSALPPPEVLAGEIAADLKEAQAVFEGIAKRLAG